MRLDSLLPVILIACLLALAYFLTKAVQASKENNDPAPAPIQLDQDDYGKSGNNGASANTDTSLDGNESSSASTSRTSNTDGDDSDQAYYDAGRSDEDTAPSSDDYRTSIGSSYTPTDDRDNQTTTSSSSASSGTRSGSTSSQASSSSSGDYLVVSGSYRQRVNADNQMRRLHGEGFPDAKVELFDKGTYALVVVNSFRGYNDAVSLRDQLRAKGYAAYIHRAD
ncbi:MAG: SPOR domain-containing protein [Bacteroidota bacterium]